MKKPLHIVDANKMAQPPLPAQPVQEPVDNDFFKNLAKQNPSPDQRPWVGLTDEGIYTVLNNLQTMYNRPPTEDSRVIFARAIEAKLKEKNHD